MIIGGATQDTLNKTTMLDTLTGTWLSLPPIPTGRYGHACIKTVVDFKPNSKVGVMVTGGQDGGSSAWSIWPGRVVEFLSLETRTWRQLGDSHYSQWGHEMTHIVSHPPLSEFRFDAPVIIGGEYEVQGENRHPETHQPNIVQTYLGNTSSWSNDWYCCIPQLKIKPSHFIAVHIELEVKLFDKSIK